MKTSTPHVQIPQRQFLVRGSYIELYNEKLYDLLNKRKRLELGLDPSGEEFRAVNRTETCAKNAAELDAVRVVGEAGKKMGVSKLNEHSSRSHAIFSIIVESTEKDTAPEAHSDDESKPTADSGGSVVRVSTLNLVDLAGSETFAAIWCLSTARAIHQPISRPLRMSLWRCPRQARKYIPQFNANQASKKLAGRNACTSVICCITPAPPTESN